MMAHNPIAIFTPQTNLYAKAEALAEKLRLPFIKQIEKPFPFLLWIDADGLSLVQTGKLSPAPIRVDFTKGKIAFRRASQQKELLLRAAGITAKYKPSIVDATAGFGTDAFILANAGCKITLLERSNFVFALLQDGIERALKEPSLQNIIENMHLIHNDSVDYLKHLNNKPDIIYLDPMFPLRKKSARVKKEMCALQQLLDPQKNVSVLFETAIKQAKKRVVVKRSRLAPLISEIKPHFQITGKSCRFDVYL